MSNTREQAEIDRQFKVLQRQLLKLIPKARALVAKAERSDPLWAGLAREKLQRIETAYEAVINATETGSRRIDLDELKRFVKGHQH